MEGTPDARLVGRAKYGSTHAADYTQRHDATPPEVERAVYNLLLPRDEYEALTATAGDNDTHGTTIMHDSTTGASNGQQGTNDATGTHPAPPTASPTSAKPTVPAAPPQKSHHADGDDSPSSGSSSVCSDSSSIDSPDDGTPAGKWTCTHRVKGSSGALSLAR
jgi:hypothetical protein